MTAVFYTVFMPWRFFQQTEEEKTTSVKIICTANIIFGALALLFQYLEIVSGAELIMAGLIFFDLLNVPALGEWAWKRIYSWPIKNPWQIC